MSVNFKVVFLVFAAVFFCQCISNGQACRYTRWGSWTSCTKSCGGGLRWRFRALADWCSRRCYAKWWYLWQSSACNTRPCRIDGNWSRWGAWRKCSVTCGGGVQRRKRTCTNPRPSGGGRPCRGSSYQTRRCSTKQCPCKPGAIVFDRCGQRCVCSPRSTLTRCTRIRKEFTSMTTAERTRYVNTIKTASTNSRYKARYDALITLHRTIFDTGIHDVNYFLPWHRWFILQYENLLRQVNCRFTVAYWDWSLVAARPWGTSPRDLWYSGSSGFGGNGVGTTRCVRSGPFRQQIWQLVPSASPRCLRRNFQGTLPTAVDVALALNTPPARFLDFELLLRGDLHDNVHCLIDGTMCTADSASAPEFFLHHGFVDKIWDDWQKRSTAHRNAYFPRVNGNMPRTTYRASAFINNFALPGGVRAEYAPPGNRRGRNIERRLRSFPVARLRAIRRIKPTGLLLKAIKLFKLKPAEVKRLKMLIKTRLRGQFRVRLRTGPGKPIDPVLGFQL